MMEWLLADWTWLRIVGISLFLPAVAGYLVWFASEFEGEAWRQDPIGVYGNTGCDADNEVAITRWEPMGNPMTAPSATYRCRSHILQWRWG